MIHFRFHHFRTGFYSKLSIICKIEQIQYTIFGVTEKYRQLFSCHLRRGIVMLFFCVIVVLHHVGDISGADPEIFQRGGGGEKENFERKVFVDTRINACTHKN